jgi:molybdopterin synthase sulfur carrier subunit
MARMPTVWIPSLLRDLTGGQEQLDAPGETVQQVIENLDARYPGVMARLCEGGQLRPTIAVVVDGITSNRRLRQRVTEASEIHFIPAISGG